MTGPALTVVRAGALTTVQDLGRPGHAHLGVPRAGAHEQPPQRIPKPQVGHPGSA
ncbi:allophanate hydrolase subunit 2 family protein, partial [Streptomyces celluloflavus]